jgi:DNA-binding SARP family transcriptional activator
MWLGVLGRLSVRDDDAEIRISAPKQRVVLAALLRRANQVVSLDELAEVLWDSTPPPTARVTLRNHVKCLRQVVGPAVSARIVTLPPGYLIEVREPELDLLRFTSLCAAGSQAVRARRWDQADASLSAALALWRGSPLADVPSEVLRRDEIPRLEQLRLQAQEFLMDAALRLGRHAEVIPELRVLVAQHRMRERFHGQLMLALYQSGQQAEALAVYRGARQMMVGELGVEPGPELRRLHQRMLAGDPDVMVRAAEAPATIRVLPRQVRAGISDFVGRESELATLSGALEVASSGETVTITVVGAPGVGKTTLAVNWARQAAGKFPDGQLYVNLRGFDPAGWPVAPTEAIQGFLDALGVPAASIPDDLPARAALYRSLTAGRRMLVLLDNARDSDQVSPLLPGSPGCLVLVTSRSELPGLVAAEGARTLRLGVFSEAEALELLARRIGTARVAAERDVARELTLLCASLPLALAITAARASARPGFPLATLARELRDANGRLDALATGEQTADIREAFSWSYRCLQPPAARMFRLLGRYPYPDITVAAAASLAATTPREARGLLRELTRCHLLAESSPGRYAFHGLLGAYAAELAVGMEDGMFEVLRKARGRSG